MTGSRRPITLYLLALGPVLAAAYAGANLVAIKAAVRAQVASPEWEGALPGPDEMTALGTDVWRVVLMTALLAGALAVAYAVIGLLLRRGSRKRTFLFVLSGVLMVPYALAVFVALLNPVAGLAALYDTPGFTAGLPGWQGGTVVLLVVAALSQAIGLSAATGEGRRALAAESG
ncbi:hypothetical protein FH608_025630 [Nonomuraea phyllanthi]|uniref:Uncharacterized protein n=1 Tax=Nonomuraea phyllanthi TaxID=2219224 RepID=A0A5C4W9Y4_9ACTN|nr:hypothetical protein [Nonomuraea phyllanthi]KAB8192838.1 hypothetical protein FH608_025630 [Nonomuraea phyllanthi]